MTDIHASRPLPRRLVLGGGLGLAAAAGTLATAPGASAASAARGGPRLRVASFNIHHGATGAEVLDLEGTARVIEAMGVDAIGLQEVDRHWSARSAFADQPAWLARRLGMRHVYGANLDRDPLNPGEPRRQYGTAILSRWPVLDAENIWLPAFAGQEQRGLLRATLRVRGTRLTFATTHLTHNNDAEREVQAARVAELLGARPERTVLTGDLNARPEAAAIRTLTGLLPDVWPAVGEGDGFTYGSLNPNARIDYVLASGDLRPVAARVVTTAPETSDHLPVVAELRIGR